MSHEFESGMFVKHEAWHQLGTVVENVPTPAEAMTIAKMDWMVDKRNLSYECPNGGRMFCKDHYAIVRDIDDSVLGYCSGQYHLWQNYEAFEWVQPLFEAGMWNMETCGSLKAGQICWILLKQDETQIVPNDVLKQYLLFTWSHNGMMPNLITPTSIRVVCNNTLQAALRGNLSARVCHKGTLPMTMKQVQSLFIASKDAFAEQMEVFKKLLGKKVDDGMIEQLCEELYGHTEEEKRQLSDRGIKADENRVEKVKKFVFEKASGQELTGRNNAYYVYNAFSELNEHYLVQRGTDAGWNILFGRGKQRNDKAINRLMAI